MRAERSRDSGIRSQLIAAALAFVRAVLTGDNGQLMVGLERVALIGSLTTTKRDPKDIDLLLTITDHLDLEPVARLGRSLKGRLQSLNHGADIFLANTDSSYLGRTCSPGHDGGVER